MICELVNELQDIQDDLESDLSVLKWGMFAKIKRLEKKYVIDPKEDIKRMKYIVKSPFLRAAENLRAFGIACGKLK